MTTPPRIAVIVSRYNRVVTDRLEAGALAVYAERHGEAARSSSVGLIAATGAFELVALSGAAARSGLYDGVVALGCVIKGETDHDVYINHAVAGGLASLAAATGIPCGFGVVTAGDADQARARADDPKGRVGMNKGREAMAATLDAVAASALIRGAALAGTPGVTIAGVDPGVDKASTSVGG